MKSAIAQFRDWMKRRGFNQHQTAVFFDWHDSVVSQYLSGLRTPDLSNAVKIEEATGIPAKMWLLSEEDKSQNDRKSRGNKRNVHAA